MPRATLPIPRDNATASKRARRTAKSRILVPMLRVGTQAIDAPASQEVLTYVVIWTCAVGRRSVPTVRSHAERGNEDFAALL